VVGGEEGKERGGLGGRVVGWGGGVRGEGEEGRKQVLPIDGYGVKIVESKEEGSTDKEGGGDDYGRDGGRREGRWGEMECGGAWGG